MILFQQKILIFWTLKYHSIWNTKLKKKETDIAFTSLKVKCHPQNTRQTCSSVLALKESQIQQPEVVQIEIQIFTIFSEKIPKVKYLFKNFIKIHFLYPKCLEHIKSLLCSLPKLSELPFEPIWGEFVCSHYPLPSRITMLFFHL